MRHFILKKWGKFFNYVKRMGNILFLLFSTTAYASTSSPLPFSSALQTLAQAIKGPWLLSASIIMVVATCFMLAFGEHSDGFRRIINIVMWLGMAFGVTSFITSMFGTGAVF